jgi:hypothetical protein
VTDGLDQALAQAGLDLLTADAGLTVYDGVVPNGAVRPYVLVYISVSRPSEDLDNPLTGRSAVWTTRWFCHCVGDSAKAARAVAQRVRTQLLDVVPVVAGLSCGPIRMESDSLPPQRDETTGVPVMDAVETYRLKATS